MLSLSFTVCSLASFETGLQAYIRCDYKEAMRQWKPLAESGDAAAQLEVGLLYWFGQGIRKDQSEAARWLTKSAKAKGLWERASENGDVDADLRLVYCTGSGMAL